MIKIVGTLACLSLLSCATSYQTEGVSKTTLVPGQESSDSVTVIPGPEYDAGWLHRIFFGDHYRDLWAAPVRVPVLDLSAFAGGLKPVEMGGGFQTKSLRFIGNDGMYYKFRSVNKNPRAVLPLELRETVAGDLAQDHISTSHPCASLIVDVLATAVGVPTLDARLVYLPDDDGLGGFRGEFGGLLGILEIYPEADEEGVVDFLGATKIRNTLKMYEAMENDSEDRPDAYAFLKARLLDIYVGDWDRHVKQWKWAQFEEDGEKVWLPIPMDRDQAMVRLDGLFPTVASLAITQFTDFSEAEPNIAKLTFSGHYLDRRLLVGLGREDWDSTVASFVAALTDDVIARAVKRVPQEYYALDGERIDGILKKRRDTFSSIADRYYGLLADYVDVHLSDKREVVAVRRIDDERVEVTAWRRQKTGEADPGRQVFHRVFHADETSEIRLYALGGDDVVQVTGEVSSSITIRVIGGKGDDEFVDESVVGGYLWGFVPFTDSPERRSYFYDHQGDNKFRVGSATVVDSDTYRPPPGGTFQY
jgi:hypothetical protein